MRYRLIARIQDGQNTIGYQVLSEDDKVLNLSKDQTIQLVISKSIVNVTYNKHTKYLSGINGLDLRKLKVKSPSDVKMEKLVTTSTVKSKTNHELAREYAAELTKLGARIDLEYLQGDRVRLRKLSCKLKKLHIPRYIDVSMPAYGVYDFDSAPESPFAYSVIEEIYIDNDPNRAFNAAYLFRCIHSRRLKVTFSNPQAIINMSNMFYNCGYLTKLDVSNLDTRNVRDMSQMFSLCPNLRELDLSHFDFSNVIDTSSMLLSCSELTKLDLPKSGGENIVNAKRMFSGCSSLTGLDLSSWNLYSLERAEQMFYVCRELISLSLPIMDGGRLKSMESMFYGCRKLRTLKLSSIDTRNVNSFENLFRVCESLETVDLSLFNTVAVRSFANMFNGCKSLKHIDMSHFDTLSVYNVSGMLYGCKELVSAGISNFNTAGIRFVAHATEGCDKLNPADKCAFANIKTDDSWVNDDRSFDKKYKAAIKLYQNNAGLVKFLEFMRNKLGEIDIKDNVYNVYAKINHSKANREEMGLLGISIEQVISNGYIVYEFDEEHPSFNGWVTSRKVKDFEPSILADLSNIFIYIDVVYNNSRNKVSKGDFRINNAISLDRRAFMGCTKIDKISLDEPSIDHIDANAFSDRKGKNKGISRIDLSESKVNKLDARAFKDSKGITKIEHD